MGHRKDGMGQLAKQTRAEDLEKIFSNKWLKVAFFSNSFLIIRKLDKKV